MKMQARALFTAASVMLLGILPATAQTAPKPLMAEDVFSNVQELKGIPVNQFMETMGFFSAALGYNCTNCHGEEVQGNWAKYADDFPVKNTAVRMIRIVNSINKNLFGGAQAVTCYTCHRGTPVPKVVPSLVEQYTAPPADDPNEVQLSARAPKIPTAEDILNRYLEAVGGEKKVAALTSYAATGHYDGFDSYHGQVPANPYAKVTGERGLVAHTTNGDSVTNYDGHNAWIMGPDRPISVLQLVPGGDFDGVLMDSALAFPGRLKSSLTDLRSGFPATKIDNRLMNVVQGMIGGSRVKLFFDKETGLLTRMFRYSKTIVGSVPVQVDFSDYREVAGVKLPFKWLNTWTDGQSTYQWDEMKPNVAIDPASYGKPVPPEHPVIKQLR